MPPSAKVSKQEILEVAFEILKNENAMAITARRLVKELNCSTHFFIALFLDVVAVLVYATWPEATVEPNLRIKFINTYIAGVEEETNLMIEDYETYLGEENACEMQLGYRFLGQLILVIQFVTYVLTK